jgi:type IV pilus assembly protein PilC
MQVASFGGKGFNDSKKEFFFSELAMLLSSGVDIHNALSIVTTDFEKKKETELFTKIVTRLISGRNFSDSLEESEAFSKLDISVIRIGENTGRLTDSLRFLADYYNRKIKQRALVVNAVSYPIFVLVFAVLAVGFLLNNVVPIFSTIYQRFGGELPFITSFVIGISNRMPLLILFTFCMPNIYSYSTLQVE